MSPSCQTLSLAAVPLSLPQTSPSLQVLGGAPSGKKLGTFVKLRVGCSV